MTTITVLAVALLATPRTTLENPVCNPVTAPCLASLSMQPSGPDYEVSDPGYLAIVSRGLAVVPELAALLADDSLTSRDVPLFGGRWAIGDIAMSALSDIVHPVRWLDFIEGNTRGAQDQCGFCVYWNYVRSSKANRVALSGRFRTWYAAHATDLIWIPRPDMRTGGFYDFRERGPER